MGPDGEWEGRVILMSRKRRSVWRRVWVRHLPVSSVCWGSRGEPGGRGRDAILGMPRA